MTMATETTLTATENARVQKFIAGMDDETASAMFYLFQLTKQGCDDTAYELMEVSYGYAPRVSERAIGAYEQFGLVRSNGTIPEPIKTAIRKAVKENYLVMRGPKDPTPEPHQLGCRCE